MKKFLIANWKSNKTITEARQWAEQFSTTQFSAEKTAVIVAPPTPLLIAVREGLPESMSLAAQDVSPFTAGSYTGAVAARTLAGLVSYAIVGHSERRRHFGETHQSVAQKVTQACSEGLTPVVCVDQDYVAEQAAAIEQELLSKCIVAYEPLGAIGTGNNVSVDEVTTVATSITANFGEVPVLYDGSVKPDNVGEYLLVSDGVLVGGASLDAAEFAQLVTQAEVRLQK